MDMARDRRLHDFLLCKNKTILTCLSYYTLSHGTLTLSLSRQCLCQAAKLIIEAGAWTGDQPNQEVQITRVGTMEVSGTLSDLGSLSSSQWSQRRRPGLIKQPAMDHRDLRDHPTLGSVTACHSVIALKIHFWQF